MLAFNLPLNSLSFGQCSFNILKEFYNQGPAKFYPIFPIGGQVDLSAYKIDQAFANWVQNGINLAQERHSRKVPCFKLWHLNGGLESPSQKQGLMTFLETDQTTAAEQNVLKSQDKVFVTNKYTKSIMEDFGADNIVYCPLGFDSLHFFDTKKQYFNDGRITFFLGGKFEARKHTAKTLAAWAKKFGNNPKYFLTAAITNHFMDPKALNSLIGQALGGKRYFNIIFIAFSPKNLDFNETLNSSDIILGMSGAEGFDLPLFQGLGLGKHAVVLNAHAHKDYATAANSVLVNPSGKIPAADGIFFHPNAPFNCGNFYDWNVDEFIAGCEAAIQRVEASKVNVEGLKLQTEFTWAKTVEIIKQNLL